MPANAPRTARLNRFHTIAEAMDAVEELLALIESEAVETAARVASGSPHEAAMFSSELAGILRAIDASRQRLAAARPPMIAAIARAHIGGPSA